MRGVQPPNPSFPLHMQMHVQIKHSLAYLHNNYLINTLAGVIIYIYILYKPQQRSKLVDVLENALFVYAFGYMVELLVTAWCIVAIEGYF